MAQGSLSAAVMRLVFQSLIRLALATLSNEVVDQSQENGHGVAIQRVNRVA
jgi:hypothetical protein